MDRLEELNSRIFQRIDMPNYLNIRLTPRSAHTKYTLPESISSINKINYNKKIGEFNDYADKITEESTLRNHYNSIQYNPNKTNNLYNYKIHNTNTNNTNTNNTNTNNTNTNNTNTNNTNTNNTNTNNTNQQLFPGLFEEQIFSNTNNKLNNFQNNTLFNNDTRQELKNS